MRTWAIHDCCSLIEDEFCGEKDRNLATSGEMRRKRKRKTHPTPLNGEEIVANLGTQAPLVEPPVGLPGLDRLGDWELSAALTAKWDAPGSKFFL